MLGGIIIYTICKNEQCEKSSECMRFLRKEGTEILFKYICGEEYNYQWFWEREKAIVQVDTAMDTNENIK